MRYDGALLLSKLSRRQLLLLLAPQGNPAAFRKKLRWMSTNKRLLLDHRAPPSCEPRSIAMSAVGITREPEGLGCIGVVGEEASGAL